MTLTTGATVVVILMAVIVLAAGFFIGESQGIKEGIEIGMNVAGYVRNMLTEETVGPFVGDGKEGEEDAESMGD